MTEESSSAQNTVNCTVKTASSTASSSSTLLKTFKTKAIGQGGKSGLIRCLMDDGSQNSWITAETVRELRLKIVGTEILRVGVAFNERFDAPESFQVAEVPLKTSKGDLFTIVALVRSTPICADLQEMDFLPQEKWSHLKGLQLADNYPRGSAKVDLLIGEDYTEHIRTGATRRAGRRSPIAVETLFGWVLGGPSNKAAFDTTACHQVATIPFEGIEESLKRFYEAETLPQDKEEATSFREEVRSKMKFDPEEKRYTVTIPYTEEVKKLGTNKNLAFKLAQKQETRLSNNPRIEALVKDYFNVQIDQGMIEEVNEDDPSSQKHYLPWHPVVREGHPTTPCRNVMNASQKDARGLSLNQCQSPGPNLLPDVAGLALRFRNNPIGIIMDVTKMFLNIKIAEDQKDLHRFFAFGKVLRQAALLFGETSSPYLALETVFKHADDHADEFKLAAKAVKDCLYMDDPILGSKSVEKGKELINEMIEFFNSMHLKVHKINSSSREVLDAFEPELLENKETSSVLGIEWNTVQDTMALKPLPPKEVAPKTKREFLATLASVYDPLGLQAPLTCRGKIIMQRIWANNFDWDSTIPEIIQKEVAEWMSASEHIHKVPRYWGAIKEVHIFCDASEQAHAAVAYGADGTGPASLMMAKTRVKPLKSITIPRMELQGAVLAANMAGFIRLHLGQSFELFFWTDSEIALGWIKNDSSIYKVFVGNRVKLIHEKTNKDSWKWVPGAENPADIPSRGIWPLNDQKKELWLHGPEFLESGCYPEQPLTHQPTEEMKKTATHAVSAEKAKPLIDISRFSNVNRLLNATSYVFRFLHRKTGASGSPTATEREASLKKLIQQDQRQYFAEEILDLEKDQLKKSSKIIGLNPFLDEGILKMQGRVATEPHLVILHPHSHLTKLLIREAHQENLHSGVSHTLNNLRAKYWIIKGFATVKATLKECITCKKAHTRLAGQQMAPLPEWRTTPSPPFTHVGVDYAGPLHVTQTGTQKRWILLFTCGTTRAVHLELTNTLETKDFLLAFSSFTARRGVPSAIYSDNGTTFVAAAKALPGIEWRFNPPFAPWHGGFWERIVRSIKTPLRKVAAGASLKETELRTLLARIEAVINSRPLTTMRGTDTHRVISPAELLCGRQLQQVAATDVELAPAKRLRHLEEVQRQFWTQWKDLYLPTLQNRPKWKSTKPGIKEGDVVLLLKENTKRHEWPLARVIEAIKGRDELVRSVKLLCDGRSVTRPIQLVVPLEVQNDEDKHTGSI